MASKKKRPYGVFNENTVVKYCIVLLFKGGKKLRFVTFVNSGTKEFKWEAGKNALFFENRGYAEDLATAMNCNNYPAFVMAVPDVFNYEDFSNPEPEKEAENADADTEKDNG